MEMAPPTNHLIDSLGPEIQDTDEETFVLFSQDIPSQNLGFIDSAATTLDITVAGRDLTIHQSPGLLTSNRAGGTTGAVVWKITPLFAEWLAAPSNILFKTAVLSERSAVLELGCGISGIVGLTVGPSVARYVLTDQAYVTKLLEQNLHENKRSIPSTATATKGRKGKRSSPAGANAAHSLHFTPLDWETDEITPQLTGTTEVRSFDAVVACDCIYNEQLTEPLVQTCADVCSLKMSNEETAGAICICIIAQQLRDPEIFDAWIKRFCESFHTWRVPDKSLSTGLRSNSGFVVHVGVLRSSLATE